MGYTHYWYLLRKDNHPSTREQQRPCDHTSAREAYGRLAMDTWDICETATNMGIEIGAGDGEGDKPEFTEGYFAFNGIKDDAHENFMWQAQVRDQDEWREDKKYVFHFCKTSRKPYDAVVCATLIRAKLIYADNLTVRSDGEWHEWVAGKMLYEETFGEDAPYPFDNNHFALID